jgi:hypothetical protein
MMEPTRMGEPAKRLNCPGWPEYLVNIRLEAILYDTDRRQMINFKPTSSALLLEEPTDMGEPATRLVILGQRTISE